MKEQLLNILHDNLLCPNRYMGQDESAHAITSHVMQFIKWLGSDVETIVRYDSIDLAYKHWLDNVYNK